MFEPFFIVIFLCYHVLENIGVIHSMLIQYNCFMFVLYYCFVSSFHILFYFLLSVLLSMDFVWNKESINQSINQSITVKPFIFFQLNLMSANALSPLRHYLTLDSKFSSTVKIQTYYKLTYIVQIFIFHYFYTHLYHKQMGKVNIFSSDFVNIWHEDYQMQQSGVCSKFGNIL